MLQDTSMCRYTKRIIFDGRYISQTLALYAITKGYLHFHNLKVNSLKVLTSVHSFIKLTAHTALLHCSNVPILNVHANLIR